MKNFFGTCLFIGILFGLSACDVFAPDTCRSVVCNDDNGVFTCVEGDCPSNPCADVICSNGFTCVDGECIEIETIPDPCEDIVCTSGFACVDGDCLALDPCTDVVCSNGFACVDGDCLALDPCTDVVCSNGLSCVDGGCVDLCDNVTCDDNEPCTEDACVGGNCVFTDVECEEGFNCNTNGECVDDLCVNGLDCLDGFTCNSITGACDPNDRCAALGHVCTFPEVCVDGACVDLCNPVDGDPVDCGTSGFVCDPSTGGCVAE